MLIELITKYTTIFVNVSNEIMIHFLGFGIKSNLINNNTFNKFVKRVIRLNTFGENKNIIFRIFF